MAKKSELLHKVIDHIDSFQENSANPHDLREFTMYLKQEVFEENSGPKWKVDNDYSNPEKVNTFDIPEVEFSTLLTSLFRFAKNYTKKAFENTSFKTLDEFGFMASIFKHRSMHKSEVINMHKMEISSGSDVIRRLLKLGLIEEHSDPIDKRAKKINLTARGQQEIITAFHEMNKVAKIVSGKLSQKELKDTIFILNKLKSFHENIHENDKGAEMEALLNKYF